MHLNRLRGKEEIVLNLLLIASMALGVVGCRVNVPDDLDNPATLAPTAVQTPTEAPCAGLPLADTTELDITLLATLYLLDYTPFQVESCFPMVGTASDQRVEIYETDLLINRLLVPVPAGDDAVVCYGTDPTRVVELCNSIAADR